MVKNNKIVKMLKNINKKKEFIVWFILVMGIVLVFFQRKESMVYHKVLLLDAIRIETMEY